MTVEMLLDAVRRTGSPARQHGAGRLGMHLSPAVGVQAPASPSLPARPRYQPLALVTAAVAIGIVIDRLHALPVRAWLALAFFAWASWFVARSRKRLIVGTASLAVSLAAVGGAWHHLRWHGYALDEIGLFAREAAHPVALRAVAIGSPRHVPARPADPLSAIPRGDRSRFPARVIGVRDGDVWRPASGVTEVWVDGALSDVAYGDRLQIVGQLSAPAGPQNPGEFDFARHSRADRRLSRVAADFVECVEVKSRGRRWLAGRWLNDVRERGHALLWRHIDPRRAALASALLLGVREELGDETNAAFAKTGTIH
ncbi:MAG: ComEC/Rec2 family competence protein [Pirellulales bacterium]